MAFEQELETARAAAARAGDKALEYWRSGFTVDSKADRTPVTAADRECERLLVQEVCARFPDDGILGEEGAEKASGSGRKWIIDPIDGTRDFIRRNRLWCNLIALEDNGEVVLGTAHFPALGETYWATRGGGAFCNGEPIRISGITEVSESVLLVNTLVSIHRSSFSRNLLEWAKHFWTARSLGGAWDAMFVASGRAEVWIEQAGAPWDLAPLKIIAEEAGARFFNFDGGSSIYGGNCVICVPALETMMRRFVGS